MEINTNILPTIKKFILKWESWKSNLSDDSKIILVKYTTWKRLIMSCKKHLKELIYCRKWKIFFYHQKCLEKANMQDSYSRDWKSIPSLTLDFTCDLRQISYCVFYELHSKRIPYLFFSTWVLLWFLPIILSISLEEAFHFNQKFS